MVKFLLLALAFGLAHAHSEIDGKWVTVAIAADNVNKIEEGGSLRIYLRELTFEGDNTFGPVYATPEFTIFANHNVDRTGQTTNVIYVYGKKGSGFLKQ
ncbi:hypothetical protein U0070_019854 [Myodes glareolus]|uniref:Uncharacterized protein n=1 Tax=Myodes glareolus TaxID=447135 RepID=A0AAW0H3H6_MYOGA